MEERCTLEKVSLIKHIRISSKLLRIMMSLDVSGLWFISLFLFCFNIPIFCSFFLSDLKLSIINHTFIHIIYFSTFHFLFILSLTLTSLFFFNSTFSSFNHIFPLIHSSFSIFVIFLYYFIFLLHFNCSSLLLDKRISFYWFDFLFFLFLWSIIDSFSIFYKVYISSFIISTGGSRALNI